MTPNDGSSKHEGGPSDGLPRQASGEQGPPSDADLAGARDAICAVLLERTGHDFLRYKPGTLLRRLHRRVQLSHARSVDDYLAFLREDPAEPELLVKDLLVGVTEFFRDPGAFHLLSGRVLPRLLDAGRDGAGIRIWVPGCSSGEEAYSIAILVREHLDRLGRDLDVRIFATDIDTAALARARAGVYPGHIAEGMSSERLARFFAERGGEYHVSRELKAMCVFTQHDLIRDPPFSSLDLVSCRNVLIYLEAELQRRLVPLFHYALRPGGHLLLGPSEGLAGHPELFEVVDEKSRLFLRTAVAARPPLEFPIARGPSSPAGSVRQATPPGAGVGEGFQRMLLEEYVPPCAIVDAAGEMLWSAGPTGRWFQQPVGTPTRNLLELARPPLRGQLRTALAQALRERRRVVRDRIPVEVDGHAALVRLTVRTVPGVSADSGLLAVLLQELAGAEGEAAPDHEPAPADEPVVAHLEDELRTTRTDLQAVVQELEAANEELQSANEELISTNEELQSSNEELQTSREEVQSINQELQRKLEELETANADLQNLFASTQIATLFLDLELRVARFTPALTSLLHLLPTDAGRPLADFASRFQGADLLALAREVLRTGMPAERQVRMPAGEWFILRVRPYRIREAEVGGVVVTFVDVTELKRAEEALQRRSEELEEARRASENERRRLEAVMQALPIGVAITDAAGGNIQANRAFEQVWGGPRPYAHTVDDYVAYKARWVDTGKPVAPHEWASAQAVLEGKPVVGQVLELERFDGKRVTVINSAAPVRDADGSIVGSAVALQDVSELRRAQEELREADRRKNEFLGVLSHELRNPLAPIRNSLHVLDRASPATEQYLRAKVVADRQVAQLTRLVDDLLDITRISSGKLQLRKGPVELGGLLRRVVEDHRSLVADAALALEVRAADGPVWIEADEARVAQAIGNLLSNAAKFTSPGGRVELDLRVEGSGAVLTVRDDGLGIAPEVLPRLFQPFVQAENTLDRSRGGLGLGLSLVKALVELHGGSVEARSEGVGRGTTFLLRLPLAAGVKDVPSTPAAAPASARRVLVIEDNVDAATSLADVLRLAGHEVEVAFSGAEGLDKARQVAPEFVLCDIGLPGMDGYAVARAFRSDPSLRSTVLVALTGYALPEDVARSRQAGFDRHLAKPPALDELHALFAAAGRSS